MKISLLLIILSLTFVSAQNNFDQIDAETKKIGYTKNLKTISDKIASFADTDEEKIRAIFVYISTHIVYDLGSFKKGISPDPNPELVIANRKAVCQGYSELFKKLCLMQNIPCEVLAGYSKGYGYRKGKKFKNTDHAWNAVKINDKWQLIDVTWGSGYVDENDNYIAQFTPTYFQQSPKQFILKHLPADPMWQLLNNNEIALSEFEKDSTTMKEFLNRTININYADTLSYWEKKDSIGKIVSSNIRIIRFNPENNDAWYKLGWFYYTLAWQRMAQLNNPDVQRDRSAAPKLAQEAINYLNESLKYMNEIGRRDPFYSNDVKAKKESIAQNLKTLEKIAKAK
ncbi:MAG: transglutaminase domain-containing protein [Bacteroidota bacterium]|nr:transglutaminase domain-containing protein [Bacteroidota bacterium]